MGSGIHSLGVVRSAESPAAPGGVARLVLVALHVEPNREQVSYIEGMGGQRAGDQVLIFLELHTGLSLLPAACLLEQVVDLSARLVEETQVIVSG